MQSNKYQCGRYRAGDRQRLREQESQLNMLMFEKYGDFLSCRDVGRS
jgi:hypothetical protein